MRVETVANHTLPPIIGLTGIIGSGKSEAGKYFERCYGYTRVRFAGPLKSMLSAYLRACGADESTIFRMLDGDMKEVESPYFGGRTSRYAMQKLGTEYGRDIMDPDFWTRAFCLNVDQLISRGVNVVVDDVRFTNERILIVERGGAVVRMINESQIGASSVGEIGHISEKNNIEYDSVAQHDGINIQSLHQALNQSLLSLNAILGLDIPPLPINFDDVSLKQPTDEYA